jgi:hypothetical protein
MPASEFNPYLYYREFGSRLLLARIVAYDYVVDDDGVQQLDGNSNPIPTGLFQIELLDRVGTFVKVPMVHGTAGNSAFVGSLPEIGAVCIVGFREGNTGMILGFVPLDMGALNTLRGEVPTMQPGEVMLQGSDTYTGQPVNDTPELGPTAIPSPQAFSTARIFLDRYGRIVIQARSYECIYGPMLVDDYTPNISFIKDPVTGFPIMFRERFAEGKVEHRVDSQGNSVQYYKGDLTLIVDGVLNFQVKNLNLGGAAGQALRDNQGNRIAIESGDTPNTQAGDVTVESVQGDATLSAGANAHIHSGGNTELVAIRSATETIGDTKTVMIGVNSQETVGGNKSEHVGLTKTEIVLGSSAETVGGVKNVEVDGLYTEQTNGNRTIGVAGALTIQVVGPIIISGTIIQLGSTAISKIVQQVALMAKFNTHGHPGDNLPPDQQLLPTDFHSTVEVGP